MNFMKHFANWRKNTAELRRRAKTLFRLYPALFILAGIICAIVYPPAVPVLFLLIFFVVSKRRALVFAVAAAVAAISVWFASHESPSSYLHKLDGRDAAAEILVRVTDTAYGGKKLPWLPPPTFFRAELLALKLNGEKAFTPVSGKIMVRAEEAAPFYGDFLVLNGTFRLPGQECLYRSTAVYPDSVSPAGERREVLGFDYGAYLKNRGIRRIFYASAHEECDGELNFLQRGYRLILRGRERILAAVTAPIRDDENKGMIAALLFGCPQGVDREARRSFIFSGTVHIFTVSGLHVGIVALLAGLLLHGVPFRWRYWLIPPVVLLYVLATGMNAPSVRAFTMIAVWCICRGALLKTPGLNLVLAAASLLLLFQPGYLFDMGFQYSFITVGFLILSAGIVSRISDITFERRRWIPPAYRTFRDRLTVRYGPRFCGALCGCVTAWLAGSAIALYYQGIYVPFSVAANLLLLPLVWLLYPLAALTAILPPAAHAVEFILELMRGICDFFYEFAGNIRCVQPPLWSLFIFFAGLTVLLGVRRRAFILGGAAVVLLTAGFWHVRALSRPLTVIVMHGGNSSVPALAIAAPGGDEAVVINAPSYEAASAMSYLLRSRGIDRIGRLVFIRGLKDYTAGTEKLLDSLTVDEIVLPPDFTRREYLSRLLPALSPRITGLVDNPKISAENQRNTIEYSCGSFIIKTDILSTGYGVSFLTLAADGYQPMRLELKNSSILEINEYEFRP